MLGIVWWLPGLLIRRLLLPIETMVNHIFDETESYLSDREKEEIRAQAAQKAADELKGVFFHPDGSPVIANGNGR